VGDDHLGRWLLDELAAVGLGAEVSVVGSEPTGLTVSCEGPQRDRSFLTFLGVNARWGGSALPSDAASCQNLLLCDYFCMPALRGAPTRELLADVRTGGGHTFFDTAWDADGFGARTRREISELLPHVDVFLPNEAEAMAISGRRGAAQAARELQAVSQGWVVVKLGAEGCLAMGPGGEELAVPAHPVRVVDSTGAGDAFNAGLISALAEGQEWREALESATALAATILARPPGARNRRAA
jgi:sugar/nucleoside kinase (ribokinase family)